MAYSFAGTIVIADPDILILTWRIALINPETREEIDSTLVNSNGDTPVDWELTPDYSGPAYALIEPLIDKIWAPGIEIGMGMTVIPNDTNNVFIYKVTAGSNNWITGQSAPTWPTTPEGTVTDGDLTLTCIGQRVQAQIEGPAWGIEVTP